MRKSIFILLIFGVNHFVAKAQTDSIRHKLDEYLIAANKVNKFNGNALIAQNGEILLQKSYGYKTF
jgi:hypothetical protein